MNIHEAMDELLIKQLLNESTSEENKKVSDWRLVSAENEKYYQDFKIIWETSKQLEQPYEVDQESAWQRFREIAHQQSVSKSVEMYPQKKRSNWTRIAAAAVIILGGTFTLNLLLGNKDIILTADNTVITDTLPDGSVVTLNKHSKLVYTKDFNKETRNVILTGEAFFNVAPNKQKPFDIAVGAVKVRVVGTSFNVKEEQEQTEVIVETGIVKVSTDEASVKLLPKEKVVVQKNNKKLDVTKSEDLLYNYYRTKTFECNNTPLYELIIALNKTYDTQIIIVGEQTKNLRMTSTFRDMPLNDILKVVTETFNLSTERKDGKIILK